jgi:hypothetical protein
VTLHFLPQPEPERVSEAPALSVLSREALAAVYRDAIERALRRGDFRAIGPLRYRLSTLVDPP